jgi:hypothetical protein
MSNQHRRSLNVTSRILSEAEGLVEYVASDATLDSYRECILSSGWRFSMFEKNSPFVDSHNYYSIEALLGKVVRVRVEGGQLIETVQWAKDVAENKLAVLGWKMTAAGFLRAVSVGFRAVVSVFPQDSGWTAALSESGLTPEDAKQCRRIFVEQEQLELSACILGANPAAVAKAYHERAITEADLAGVGFTDDDMHFLTIAGTALERPALDEVTRLMIGREMGRITKRNFPNPPPTAPNTSPAPSQAERDARARAQQAERNEFLRQLRTAVEKR